MAYRSEDSSEDSSAVSYRANLTRLCLVSEKFVCAFVSILFI